MYINILDANKIQNSAAAAAEFGLLVLTTYWYSGISAEEICRQSCRQISSSAEINVQISAAVAAEFGFSGWGIQEN
jgi:hypothetical protein